MMLVSMFTMIILGITKDGWPVLHTRALNQDTRSLE